MASEKNTLKVVGLTCGALVLIGGLALGGAAFFLYRSVKDVALVPEESALRLLGMSALPEGYYANLALSIPMVMDTVILSDHPNEEEGKVPPLGQGTGFLYSYIKLVKEQDREGLEAFFKGETQDMSVLRKNKINVDFDPEDILARGFIEGGSTRARYLTTTKGVSDQNVDAEGLTTFFLFLCNDQKLRFGLWFSPVQVGDDPAAFDLTGTVGDEAEIQRFVAHFNLCGAEPEGR